MDKSAISLARVPFTILSELSHPRARHNYRHDITCLSSSLQLRNASLDGGDFRRTFVDRHWFDDRGDRA